MILRKLILPLRAITAIRLPNECESDMNDWRSDNRDILAAGVARATRNDNSNGGTTRLEKTKAGRRI